MLADVQTRNDVAVIDSHESRRAPRPLPGCDHPHGLLVDAPRRLAASPASNVRGWTLDLDA